MLIRCCGTAPEVNFARSEQMYYVMCIHCCDGPYGYEPTQKDAIDAWNRYKSSLGEPSAWLPIEDASQDGSRVLVIGKNEDGTWWDDPELAIFISGVWQTTNGLIVEPTHCINIPKMEAKP